MTQLLQLRATKGKPRARGGRLPKLLKDKPNLALVFALVPLSITSPASANPSAGTAATTAEPSDTANVRPNEIVVTAQRRSQNIQDVAASVAAVSGASLVQRNIVTVNDLASSVSNLQVANPYGTGSPPAFTIRGISSTDFSANQSRPIAVNIDEGIRQLPSFETVPLFDIDHIEVLRGPQGALYGKNATGGAINIINKKPTFTTSGYFSAGYGNFNRRESSGAIQTALVPEVLALRVAYTYEKNSGTIKNLFPGAPNVNQADVFGVRGTVLFKPSPAVELVARFTHSSSGGRNPGIYADNVDYAAAGFPELALIPGNNRQGLGFFENYQNFIGHRDIKTDGANIQLSVKLSDAFTLTSITTYDRGKWIETVDTDGTAVDQERDSDNANNERQFVQEVRLAGKVGLTHLLFGAFYSHDNVDINYQYRFFQDPRCTVSCDSAFWAGINDGSLGYTISNFFNQRRKSYSAYGRVEYDLTDQLQASAGVRWTRDQVAIKGYNSFLGDRATPLAIETISATDLSKSFRNVSAEAVLTWKPNSDITTYASFKQGYRTGAINAQAFNSLSEVVFAPPEKANSWEAGIKTKPMPGLTFNVAAFYATYRNQQITSLEQLNGGNIYPLRSIDKARSYGLEADLNWKVASGLYLASSLGYTNAKYVKGVVAGINIAGNPLTNAAKWSGNSSIEWRAVRVSEGELVLRADATYQSRVSFDVHNYPYLVDDGHVVAGGSITYEKPSWSVGAWVTNAFNEHYFTNALNTVLEGFTYKVRGTPREFGGRFTVRF